MSTVLSLICLGPSFQKMTHHFLLHGSLRPTNLEKNLKPWTNPYSDMMKIVHIWNMEEIGLQLTKSECPHMRTDTGGGHLEEIR